MSVIGDIHIEGGNYAGFSDFHGALDLSTGTNTVILVPKNSGSPEDVVAAVMQKLLVDSQYLSKIVGGLASRINSAIHGLTFESSTIYDDALNAFLGFQPPTPINVTPASIAAVIPATGGVVALSNADLGLGEVKLTVPVNALDQSEKITVERVADAEVESRFSRGASALPRCSPVFELKSESNAFYASVTLELPIISAVPASFPTDRIKMVFFRDGFWNEVPNIQVDLSQRKVTAQISHFTPFSLTFTNPRNLQDFWYEPIDISKKNGKIHIQLYPKSIVFSNFSELFGGNLLGSYAGYELVTMVRLYRRVTGGNPVLIKEKQYHNALMFKHGSEAMLEANASAKFKAWSVESSHLGSDEDAFKIVYPPAEQWDFYSDFSFRIIVEFDAQGNRTNVSPLVKSLLSDNQNVENYGIVSQIGKESLKVDDDFIDAGLLSSSEKHYFVINGQWVQRYETNQVAELSSEGFPFVPKDLTDSGVVTPPPPSTRYLQYITLSETGMSVNTNGIIDLGKVIVTAHYSTPPAERVTNVKWYQAGTIGTVSGAAFHAPATAGTASVRCEYTPSPGQQPISRSLPITVVAVPVVQYIDSTRGKYYMNTNSTMDLNAIAIIAVYTSGAQKSATNVSWSKKSGMGTVDAFSKTFTSGSTSGFVSLTCKFTDENNVTVQSDVTIVVEGTTLPNVQIVEPLPSATLTGNTVTVRVKVNNTSTIQRIDFGIGSEYKNSVFSKDSAGYYVSTIDLTGISNGLQRIIAKAYTQSSDNWGTIGLYGLAFIEPTIAKTAKTLTEIAVSPISISLKTGENYILGNITTTAKYSDGTSQTVSTVTFSLKSGVGSVSTLYYSAGPTAGSAVITVTYAEGGVTRTVDLSVTVTSSTTPTNETTMVDLGGGVSMSFVEIPAGSFQMGSTSGDSYEQPVHQVTLTKAFYMAKHEVTQEQYEKIVGTNPSNFKSSTSGKQPVERVSWFDAVRFCNALSAAKGLIPCYKNLSNSTNIADGDTVDCDWNASGYRLPTEAEWEYACRAGTTTAYYWGDAIDGAYAWYLPNYNNTTHNVCEKTANAWGLHDMSGNVWEWCWDWSGTYGTAAQTDPSGAGAGTVRVFRGGSWSYDAYVLRSAARGGNYPTYRHNYLGFRPLRIIP